MARAARGLDLPRRLAEAVRLKRRDRGASDAEMLWSLIASLSAGNGALSDLDALRADPMGCELLGLRRAPSGRRLEEYLARFGEAEVSALGRVARGLARQLARAVVEHEVAARGYVPVFVDGSAIEVGGALFEGAGKGYDGTVQYWLHGVFLGPLWVGGRLHPGGVGVTRGWREQLEADVAPLLDGRAPVWVRADNAYYKRDFARYCRERGWDYSVSVTHGGYRRPVLVRRHRGKQGRENAFKGPLIDLDLHHPPCRSFRANQAFYACGQIAQLLLRATQYGLLPAKARAHGLRTLIRHLIRTVARLVRTGRHWRLDFAKSNFRLDWLLYDAWQHE